jgi:lysyl-tRNA synthetase class II
MKNEGIETFESRVDPNFTVIVIYKGYGSYDLVKESLQALDNSIAALLPGHATIIVDGERVEEEGLTDDHLLSIEAHEIAHERLGHSGKRNQTHEKEADELAIRILDSLNKKEAADLLRERVKSL